MTQSKTDVAQYTHRTNYWTLRRTMEYCISNFMSLFNNASFDSFVRSLTCTRLLNKTTNRLGAWVNHRECFEIEYTNVPREELIPSLHSRNFRRAISDFEEAVRVGVSELLPAVLFCFTIGEPRPVQTVEYCYVDAKMPRVTKFSSEKVFISFYLRVVFP